VATRGTVPGLYRNAVAVPGWDIRIASTWRTRALGLLLLPPLATQQGLWISPCASVHTVGMRCVIDVVFVDRHHRVVKLAPHIRPFWGAVGWGAHSTLELHRGAIEALALRVGEELTVR
jgi:uncharacterized membrane protein (UPF0127 family)